MMDVLLHETHAQDFLVYLYKLYQGQLLCDINIESRDGVVFWTHRLVLSASSAFIHQILLTNPGLNSLKLDIHSEVLLVLLEYGYTGQLFLSNHLHYDVHGAATYLQMYAVLDLLKKYPETENQTYQHVAHTVDQPVTDKAEVEHETAHPEVKSLRQDLPSNTLTGIKQNERNKDVMVEISNDVDSTCLEGEEQMPMLDIIQEDSLLTNRLSNIKRCKPLENKGLVILDSMEKPRGKKCNRKLRDKHSNYKIPEEIENKVSEIDKSKKKGIVRKIENDEMISKCRKRGSKKSLNVKRILKSSNDSSHGNNRKRRLKQDHLTKIKNKVKTNKRKHKHSKKLFLKCLYCSKRLPLGLKRFKHVLKRHKNRYLGQLFSRFLLKRCKTVKCRMSSFLETGSETFISCNICGKKFTRYSLLNLHIISDHSLNKGLTWFSFLSTKCQNMCKKSQVPKYKILYTKSKTLKRQASRHTKSDKKHVNKNQLKSSKMKEERNKKAVQKKERPGTEAKSVFKCCICSKGLQSEVTLQKHLEGIHSLPVAEAKQQSYLLGEEMKCEVTTCQFMSRSLLEIRDHVLMIHPYISHNCVHCKAVFRVPLMLERHVLSKHHGVGMSGNPKVKDRTFMCGVCGRNFPRAASLRRHEHFTHGIKTHGVKVYKCDHEGCNYETAASSSLKLHASKHTTEKRYTCEYCGMKLKTDVSHKKHVSKMHLGVRPFLCQVCGMSFGEDHELKSHMNNRHTTTREFKCQYCTYSSNVKYTFFTHVFNVHNIRDKDDKRKEYQCSMCNYKTVLHHKFKIHMNGHTDTRNYWCNICNKSFVSSSTLHSHKQWVHSDNYFSCTQCDYQTKTKQKLNEHLRVQHQLRGLKPYKCPYCDFRCATGGNTRKHIKQVHRGYNIHYFRDDEMLQAARVARANGQHNTLAFVKSPSESQSRNSLLYNGKVENLGYQSNLTVQNDMNKTITQIC